MKTDAEPWESEIDEELDSHAESVVVSLGM